MKGYIYTMYAGADPSCGWVMNDPTFRPIPTLGACVPNVRRAVEQGDYIFAVSGRVVGSRQFVVGGFKVREKIDALAAYDRFPENRLRRSPNGQILGNIIVDENGNPNPLDQHSGFERRIDNYIVGEEPVFLDDPDQFVVAQDETLPLLRQMFDKPGNRVFDVIGRWRKMDEAQVAGMIRWLQGIKT